MSRKYFRERLTLVSKGTATENIYGNIIDVGHIGVYTRVSIENLDNAMTEFRVGADSAKEFHVHEEQDTPDAATLYWLLDPLYVYASERLQVLITGATLGDRIRIHTQGYVEVEDA